jgi:hypothetical protein
MSIIKNLSFLREILNYPNQFWKLLNVGLIKFIILKYQILHAENMVGLILYAEIMDSRFFVYVDWIYASFI